MVPIRSRKGLTKPVGIALVVITALSLAVAGYSALTPHVANVTQQQFITNTQSFVNKQTATIAGTMTMTAVVTTTNNAANLPPGYYQYCAEYNCNPYPAPPGYYSFGCASQGPYSSPGLSSTVQCTGWLYKDPNGCVDLMVPVDDGYTNQIQQYYSLQNLPSSYPSIGSWVTVKGQLYQNGQMMGPSGGACPASYITVTSIS
jgi:hypothetical protein